MKDMATQMQALDDFVSRARSQNEQHHASHLQSLQGLASTVNHSYTSIGDHFVSTYDRVRDVGTDISSRTSSIQASLPALTTTIQQPLSELRSNITNAPLKEYIPTGETPQKTQYQFPTALPHTEPHEKLLIKHSLRLPSTITTSTSPSKSLIYTDTPPSTTSAPSSPTKGPPGLRELDMNVALGSSSVGRHSDPALVSAKPASDGEAVDLSKSVSGGMGPPPLKRHNTASGESRLPTKFGGGKGVLRGGGVGEKENREGLGAARRLRSSQAG
jgi:kinesin family protein 11